MNTLLAPPPVEVSFSPVARVSPTPLYVPAVAPGLKYSAPPSSSTSLTLVVVSSMRAQGRSSSSITSEGVQPLPKTPSVPGCRELNERVTVRSEP